MSRGGPVAARRRALALLAPLAVAGLVGVGCSSGEDDATRSSPDEASTTTVATRPAPGPPDDPAVVGTWTADGGDALVDALTDQGLDETPTCEGTVTLELGGDGAFHRTTRGTCAFGADDAEVELMAAGGFTTAGGELVLTDVSGSGSLRGGDGEVLEIPARQVEESSAVGYAASDDELTLVVGGEGEPVRLTFVRA